MVSKKMALIVSMGMLLGTTGCFNEMLEKVKSICPACTKMVEKGIAKKDVKEEEMVREIPSIGMGELKEILESNDNVVLINTLAPQYYNDCHIIGSINVPLATIEGGMKEIKKDAPIILYCAHGSCPVSQKAAAWMYEHGYTNVREYKGGMKEWYEAGNPYEGPAEAEYLKAK